RIAHSQFFERRDRIALVQGERNRLLLTVRNNRPRDCFVPEILRDLDREHTPLASNFEKCRLTLIERARLNLVVGADWNVECLLVIAGVVTNEQGEAAVGVRVPALKCRRDARATFSRGIQRQRALWSLGRRHDEGPKDQDSRQKRLQQLLLLWDVRGA